ncbi:MULTISPECIES: hypothetical protein [Yersinia]|uniref:hypothetical protein n=1 Tax=Yersinia TaxID=629 RepID=UPI00067E5592|nr:hypothetical protein [Yersinia intermedia]
MTIDTIVRYAENISNQNEIANFHVLDIPRRNIAAVSWERPNVSREDGAIHLLNEMVKKLSRNSTDVTIYMHIQLSSFQPDSAIVRYKKTWGLLKSRGYDVDFLLNKEDFIACTPNGLILSGVCHCPLNSIGYLKDILNAEKKIFFAFTLSNISKDDEKNMTSETEWMDFFWSTNGVIFMILGSFDEANCEVVALGKQQDIAILKQC